MFLTALVFVLLLSGLVLVHEWGHFIVARLCGVRVDQFSILFPPHILKKKYGETEYALGIIPLGGYVKLYGEDADAKGQGSFTKASRRARLGIIVAGVGMNVITAIALLTIGFTVGMPPVVSTPAQLGVNTPAEVIITLVAPGSPAEQVGIQTGDTVLNFTSAAELQAFTKSHQGQEVEVSVQRGDKTLTVRPMLATDGPALGVGLGEATIIKVGPVTALRLAVTETGHMIAAMGRFLQELFVGLFGHAKLAEGVTGPVGIFVFTGQAIDLGLVYVIQLAAMISINLALVNILPFPGLDGGRAFFIILEGLFGKTIVHEKYEAVIHMLGFWLLIIFFVAITVRDVVRFF